MESETSNLDHHNITRQLQITNETGQTQAQYYQYQQQHHLEDRSARHNTNSIASTTHSYGHRDSRLHSIYDQYLSDPADSSIDHPLQQQQQPVVTPPLPSFIAQQTIRKDSLANSDIIEEMSSPTRYNHQVAPASRGRNQNDASKNRESQADGSAWAGMMTGNVVSDDSDSDDSDDERIRIPKPTSRAVNPSSSAAPSHRTSWGSRAAAVGSRPPDSASQNPPTLKLLGLKSVKEGGAPIGFNANGPRSPMGNDQPLHRNPVFNRVAEEEKDRVVSTSDYGDELDRHDSFIEEMNGRNQPIASSPQKPPMMGSSDNRPVSPRTALTQQLGLITPQVPQASSPHEQSHQRQNGSDRYFPSMMTPSSSSGESSSNHSQSRTLLAASQHRGPAPSALAIPAPQGYPRDQQSPVYPPSSPSYSPIPPPAAISMRGAAPAPMPIPLPSPIYPQNPNNGYYGGQQNARGPPGPAPGPGFSDTPQGGGRQMKRQPSLLRRSMAFITGSGSMVTPSQYGQQARQGNVGNGQRRSLFRKSMAFLSGKPMPQQAPPVQLGLNDECDTPQPRVAGFVDEKPKNRKSEYLGGGGLGDEWDYTGTGAKFWKRFSMAQRKEMQGANKDSEQFRKRTERRRKWIMYMSLLGGVCIIGAVIGVVIWRESVTSSTIPGALDREHNGVNAAPTPVIANTAAIGNADSTTAYNNQQQTAAGASSSTSTSRKHRNTANGKRHLVLATASPMVAGSIRDITPKSASFYGGPHPLPRRNNAPLSQSRKRRHLHRVRSAETTPAPILLD